MALAATALANGVRALLVTLGPRGAAFFAAPGFDGLADLARDSRLERAAAGAGPIRTARVAIPGARQDGDPTGCGDVWGATCFSRLLQGDSLREAIGAAHRAAARNVAHRGATGLARHLRGEILSR
jgi:sugar/nucleoside kinase (ribokinase family)